MCAASGWPSTWLRPPSSCVCSCAIALLQQGLGPGWRQRRSSLIFRMMCFSGSGTVQVLLQKSRAGFYGCKNLVLVPGCVGM